MGPQCRSAKPGSPVVSFLRLGHPSITHTVGVIRAAGIFEAAHILRALRCVFGGYKRGCFI